MSFRSWVIGLLCASVAVAALAAIGFDVTRRAEGMRLADTSSNAILSASPGTPVKAVVRVEAPSGAGTFTALLLQNVQGAEYRETRTRIRLTLSSGTHFVMGASPDVKSGAIVQADGAMDAGNTLLAAKIVVLDDYVHVTR
jgi:hypothetical protein